MIFLDIETIPDQSPGAIELIAKDLSVKPPASFKKPDFIQALSLGDQGKYKTVDELKAMWVEEFGESQRLIQAEEKWLKTSLDGSKGQICSIGLTNDMGAVEVFSGDEKTTLQQFWSHVLYLQPFDSAIIEPTFVAHNKSFDLPFIFKRSVINGVKPPFDFNPYSRKHVCTMELWEGYGGKISLKNLANILGLGGKLDDIDGSQVWPMYQACEFDKIDEYCKQDVLLLRDVYNIIKFNK